MDPFLQLHERHQHFARQHSGANSTTHSQSILISAASSSLASLPLPRLPFFALRIDDPRTQSPVSLTFSAPQSAVMTKVGERGRACRAMKSAGRGREREKSANVISPRNLQTTKFIALHFPMALACMNFVFLFLLSLRGFVIESFLKSNVGTSCS